MWNSIKSFFGVSPDDESPSENQVDAATKQLKEAKADLDKLSAELTQVETAIKDSKRLVAKAELQQNQFKITLHNLEMELHDDYLHPPEEEAEEDRKRLAKEAAADANNSNNNNANDDDDDDINKTDDIPSSNSSARVRKNLEKAIHALETLYLPQIENQRDSLDLTTFRLGLRLSKLRAEEQDARRRMLTLQAEAHERWEKYRTVSNSANNDDIDGKGERNEKQYNNVDIVPRPSSAAAVASIEDQEHQRLDSEDEDENENDDDTSAVLAPPPPELVVKR